MKYTLLLSFALCQTVAAFAQRTDEKVTALLNNYIYTQNKYSALKKTMPDVYLVNDPATNTERVQYATPVSADTKATLEKYSKEEQVKILKSKPFPVGETLTILDTSGFFKQPVYTFKDGPAIKVVNKAEGHKADHYMRLAKFTSKATDVLVFIYLDEEGNFHNYSITLAEQPLALKEIPW
jgi:hypothetical protein